MRSRRLGFDRVRSPAAVEADRKGIVQCERIRTRADERLLIWNSLVIESNRLVDARWQGGGERQSVGEPNSPWAIATRKWSSLSFTIIRFSPACIWLSFDFTRFTALQILINQIIDKYEKFRARNIH